MVHIPREQILCLAESQQKVLLCSTEPADQELDTHVPLNSDAFYLYLSQDPYHFLPGTTVFYILVLSSRLSVP